MSILHESNDIACKQEGFGCIRETKILVCFCSFRVRRKINKLTVSDVFFFFFFFDGT